MVFSANRSHWFSACELSIFVLTGGHCVQTHRSREIFLGRAHYLMHECRRLLNGETGQTGPLRASLAEMVDVVTLAPVPAAATPADSGAREPAAQGNAGGPAADTGGGGEFDDADADSGAGERAEGCSKSASNADGDDGE